MMRIVFFGSSAFSVPILSAVAGQTVCVVTKKAKPKGRGYSVDDNEVAKTATALDIPIIEIHSFKDETANLLSDYHADLFVVASFGLIIPKWALDLPLLGPVNVHPSLLPLYRGSSPMQWAILNGDQETGITFIRMNEKMDEGNIIYQERISIEERENYTALSRKLSKRAAKILPEVLADIGLQGMPPGTVQGSGLATYTSIIKKEMGKIDWKRDAVSIDRQVRAFVDWPVAHCILDGKTVKIFGAEVDNREYSQETAGRVRDIGKEGILVETGHKMLLIKELQMENKKIMSAHDFARGYRGLSDKTFF